MTKDKHQIKWEALGVAQSWLLDESHLDLADTDKEIKWAMEAQAELANFAVLLAERHRQKSKTINKHANSKQ